MKTKNLVEALVSFGAAIVILGALFKLEHLEFASAFLWIGLITEAVIFSVYGLQYLFGKSESGQPTMVSSNSNGEPLISDKLQGSVDELNKTIKTIFNR